MYMTSANSLIKTEEQIEKMRESGRILAQAFEHVKVLIKPGVTPLELDKVADEFIVANGGYPAFKGYKVGRNTFKWCCCMSKNEAVVHGIPDDVPLKEGDILTVDMGVKKDGWYADSAWTYPVGEVAAETLQLLDVTRESLMLAIAQAKAGNKLFDIANAVQGYCEAHGYGIVRELVGHGIGRYLHEEPQVPNYVPGRFEPFPNIELKEGMTLAIEPMVNMGTARVKTLRDKWTVVTADGKPSAHFEHTVVVRRNGGEILTKL
jgi:methionyl aminopeptidase